MNHNQQMSFICQWTRVETELRLEPLNGRLTWIRAHKLEPCMDMIMNEDKVGSEVLDRGRRKRKRDGIVSRFTWIRISLDKGIQYRRDSEENRIR